MKIVRCSFAGTQDRVVLIQGTAEGLMKVQNTIIEKVYDFPVPKDLAAIIGDRPKQVIHENEALHQRISNTIKLLWTSIVFVDKTLPPGMLVLYGCSASPRRISTSFHDSTETKPPHGLLFLHLLEVLCIVALIT